MNCSKPNCIVPNLNICKYSPVRICDEFGVNARFNFLFKEVCSLKNNPYILPIASSTILGGIRVGSGLAINASTGILTATGSGGGIEWVSITQADFEGDGKTYLNSDFTSNTSIFWNDINRFIYEAQGEWQYVAGGIEILMPGFDASQNPCNLEIIIKP
jgi:hypothetical protein